MKKCVMLLLFISKTETHSPKEGFYPSTQGRLRGIFLLLAVSLSLPALLFQVQLPLDQAERLIINAAPVA